MGVRVMHFSLHISFWCFKMSSTLTVFSDGAVSVHHVCFDEFERKIQGMDAEEGNKNEDERTFNPQFWKVLKLFKLFILIRKVLNFYLCIFL